MAKTKLKKRNLNRYRKIYPYLRRAPKNGYVSDRPTLIEVGSVSFSNRSSYTYEFQNAFKGIPTVTATAVDIDDGPDFKESGDADVNVFISSISSKRMTIETSQEFTGRIDFHIIEIIS